MRQAADKSEHSGCGPGLIRLGRRPPIGDYLRQLWQRREFITGLATSELHGQHIDTTIGSAWHLLNPVLLVGVYFVVFDMILNAGAGGEHSYVAFLSLGIFPFTLLRKALQTGSRSIIANLDLIRSFSFPRATLPISAVVAETLASLMSVGVMIAFVLITGVPPRTTWLLIPLLWTLLALFAAGVACGVARLSERFRDIERLLPFVLQVWLYLSGVLYSVESVVASETLRQLFNLNPVYPMISALRDAVLEGRFTGELWLMSAGWAVLTVTVGFVFFWRSEQSYGR